MFYLNKKKIMMNFYAIRENFNPYIIIFCQTTESWKETVLNVTLDAIS